MMRRHGARPAAIRGGAKMHGFSLVEVLLATMLLAGGLVLAFASLRAAGAAVQRGEAMAARNDRIRAVSGFLQRRIGGAQGLVFGVDASTGASQRFAGTPQSMRFVADVPDYLGRGGPHLHELRVANGTLLVDFRMVIAGNVLQAPSARPPEPLVTGLRSIAFDYRSVDDDGRPGAWVSTWQASQALPLQVRVRMADHDGAWPDLVVTLPLAASYGSPAGAIR